MTSETLGIALAVVVAYFLGAVPFAYLIGRWAGGVDLREVGSGNVGATNLGRVLGFRYFLLAFLLDGSKGFLPTWGFPRLVAAATGSEPAATAGVLVALAAILGHNFPVYLRFRGGKGVATSLGAVLALDPVAGIAAALGFLLILVATRMVSLGSVGGGLVFAWVHFQRVADPWGRKEFAMSALTIGLLGLLVARHRKNFARIARGTEPKVPLGRRRPAGPPGRIGLRLAFWLVFLSSLAGGVGWWASRVEVLRVGPFRFVQVARVGTGHQRTERLAFCDGGRLLAVTCPRYGRVVIYRVTDGDGLEVVRDVRLEGRPVALWPTADRIYVLQRPMLDARHVEPGWWDTVDLAGNPVGSRFRVGFDPDDMALSPDGRWAFVSVSGNAEGEENRPGPELLVVDLGAEGGHPTVAARLPFDRPGDDPERVRIAPDGATVAVTFAGSDDVAWVDVRDRLAPKAEPRGRIPAGAAPGQEFAEACHPEREVVHLPGGSIVVATDPKESALLVGPRADAAEHRLPLRGTMNLGKVIPIGLAFEPGRGLLAVATRSGAVHLIAARPEAESRPDAGLAASASATDPARR